MCMHVHAYMHGRVCARPAVSVACTLEQVFWALVHGRVCTLRRCVFIPTYTSVTHSLQVVHVCVYVYMCVDACVCVWMRVCVYVIAWHVEALSLVFSVCAYVCICMRMCVWVHVCVYGCMRMCVYVCIYFCVYVCMCVCVRAHVDVRMHSCRRILFICTVQSWRTYEWVMSIMTHIRMSHVHTHL